jgi:hypothetical protein
VKIARNVKAISKILYILLLVLAMVIGSIFSYMILAGYYLGLENNIPENPTISVIDVGLDVQNAESFTITILNPTYSPSEALISEAYIIADDVSDKILSLDPTLPYELGTGENVTFNCNWNWGNYIGETLKVVFVVNEGSGAVYEIETAVVGLDITAAVFDTEDTEHFDLTVKNPDYSVIDLSLTKITVTMENGTVVNIRDTTPTIPATLPMDSYTTFTCGWDWTTYRGQNVTVSVYTSQGYDYHLTKTTPRSAQLSITDVNFDVNNASAFELTVENSKNSIVSANLTSVEMQLEDSTIVTATIEQPADLPYTLEIGETVTIRCLWDWSSHRQETITLAVQTEEGFIGYLQTQTS